MLLSRERTHGSCVPHNFPGALQVYASIDQNLQQQQQQPPQPQATQLGGSLSPQQLLKGIRSLAGLKYTQPVQLASWLEAAAPPAQQAAGSTQPHTAAGSAAAAAAGGVDGGGGAAAAAGITGYRQVLSTLRMHELAALIANLARAGVRPSNVWLLAFMQVCVAVTGALGHALQLQRLHAHGLCCSCMTLVVLLTMHQGSNGMYGH